MEKIFSEMNNYHKVLTTLESNVQQISSEKDRAER